MARMLTLLKILASAALLASTAWIVWQVGLRPIPVYADIYAPLLASAGFLPPPPGERQQFRRGEVMVNGARFNYVVGSSRQSLDAVLSHYEQQFAMPKAADRRLFSAARIGGQGAGVVAGIKFGPVSHAAEHGPQLGAFAESRRLEDFGTFHVIAAFAQRETVFIDFSPASDTTLDRLLPPEGTDAPGQDLPGVARPSSLQRLFTIRNGADDRAGRVWIYRAVGSQSPVEAYRRALRAAQWREAPDVHGPALAHFTNAEGEVFVGGAGRGADAIVIVIHRTHTHAERES
jgi:hypothetical protein